MLGFRYLFLCGVLAISLTCVYGLSNEEKGVIKDIMLPFMMECGKIHGVTKKEFKAAKEAGTLQILKPCLLSCVLKKFSLFDSNGLFDKEIATALSTKFLSDGDDQLKALEIIHTCAAVNDQTFSDGHKGCERAKVLIDCYMDHKGTLPGTPC